MSASTDDDETESGSGKRGVTGYMDGLHSPWGVLGRIMSERGYTREQVLWKNSWINLLMESADAPKYIKGSPPAPVASSKEDLDRILGRKNDK